MILPVRDATTATNDVTVIWSNTHRHLNYFRCNIRMVHNKIFKKQGLFTQVRKQFLRFTNQKTTTFVDRNQKINKNTLKVQN